MAAAVPSTDITALLGSLLGIIEKYEANSADDPPNEGDYLLAMNTLKALNDRKGQFGPAHNQVVIQYRERMRHHRQLHDLSLRHCSWWCKKLADYILCADCGGMLYNEYALNRHKKRAACVEGRARLEFMSPQFQKRVTKWNARGCDVNFPLVMALHHIHRGSVMQVINKGPLDYPEGYKLLPRRFIPTRLWESMWSATAQQMNPQRALVYTCDMFVGTMKNVPGRWERHSLMSGALKIHIDKFENQVRYYRPEFPPIQYHWTTMNGPDARPLYKMYLAPETRPRWRSFGLAELVAGARSISNETLEEVLARQPVIDVAVEVAMMALNEAAPAVAPDAVAELNEESEEDDNDDLLL
jgi:hypothetical protein